MPLPLPQAPPPKLPCSRQGWDVRGMAADVSLAADRAALVAAASDAFGGRVEVLFNNVGTNIRKAATEYTEARQEGGREGLLQVLAAGGRVWHRALYWSRAAAVLPTTLLSLLQADWQRLMSVNLESGFALSQVHCLLAGDWLRAPLCMSVLRAAPPRSPRHPRLALPPLSCSCATRCSRPPAAASSSSTAAWQAGPRRWGRGRFMP